MRQHYDADIAEALCEALVSTEPVVSVRLNTRKLNSLHHPLALPESHRVEWCRDAFYLSERPPFTFDPLLHAGAYYVQ